MATAEFDIPEGHTFLEGVAVVRTADSEGRGATAIVSNGEPSTDLMLGMLTGALERMKERSSAEWNGEETP